MKRNKHSLSHYRLTTMIMGDLIPVGWYEALPGDTIQQASSCLMRLLPLQAPVMHPVSVRLHHWFVPNRLLCDEPQDWENFITGNDPEVVLPTIESGGGGFLDKTLADYFGLPLNVPGLTVSAFPWRAYNLIFNEFYRDQDLVNPVSVQQNSVQKIAWEKDYFTSARPWPQKGPDITLPLGVSAPVRISSVVTSGGTDSQGSLEMFDGTHASDPGGIYASNPATTGDMGVDLIGIADLANATSVNVNDVRRAFALQRYQEARAMYGSRYTEYLRYLGVRSSDARLQRPEYLGGGKQTIAFSEVLQTALTPESDPAEGVGNMFGHGIAAMRSRRFRRFFEEHGIVMTLMSVRPRTMYMNGIPRSLSRVTKEDYWQKELEHIGQQEILNKEIFADGSSADDEGFGWQDRYAEYRHIQSGVSGDFRSSLNFWHLARDFSALPDLNTGFVECDASERIFSVQNSDQLLCMVNHSVQARRMVSRSTVGRIV